MLLIAAALIITVAAMLFSVFDSPKYNSLEAKPIVITAATETSTHDPQKININTAGVDELTQLEEIGNKKAQAIIDYREKNGKFRTPEELTNVSGISDGIYNKNIDRITV